MDADTRLLVQRDIAQARASEVSTLRQIEIERDTRSSRDRLSAYLRCQGATIGRTRTW